MPFTVYEINVLDLYRYQKHRVVHYRSHTHKRHQFTIIYKLYGVMNYIIKLHCSLILPLFLEIHVSSQETEQSCIRLMSVSICNVVAIPPVWHFMFLFYFGVDSTVIMTWLCLSFD